MPLTFGLTKKDARNTLHLPALIEASFAFNNRPQPIMSAEKLSREEALSEMSRLRSTGGSSMFSQYRDDITDLGEEDVLKITVDGGYGRVSGLRRYIESNIGEEFTVKATKAEGEKDKDKSEASYVCYVFRGDV